MKTKLLSLVALSILIFSCKDVAEPSPNLRIQGMYESIREAVTQSGEVEYNLVDRLEFKADGTFAVENITLSSGTDEVLGYRAVYSGTYTIADQKVTITYEDPLGMNMMDIYYVPKADLTLFEGQSYFAEYAIAEDFSKLSSICSPYALCVPPAPYLRVDSKLD